MLLGGGGHNLSPPSAAYDADRKHIYLIITRLISSSLSTESCLSTNTSSVVGQLFSSQLFARSRPASVESRVFLFWRQQGRCYKVTVTQLTAAVFRLSLFLDLEFIRFTFMSLLRCINIILGRVDL